MLQISRTNVFVEQHHTAKYSSCSEDHMVPDTWYAFIRLGTPWTANSCIKSCRRCNADFPVKLVNVFRSAVTLWNCCQSSSLSVEYVSKQNNTRYQDLPLHRFLVDTDVTRRPITVSIPSCCDLFLVRRRELWDLFTSISRSRGCDRFLPLSTSVLSLFDLRLASSGHEYSAPAARTTAIWHSTIGQQKLRYTFPGYLIFVG